MKRLSLRKSRKIEPQDAFGSLRGTLKSLNRLAGAKENLRFPAIRQEEGLLELEAEPWSAQGS